MKTDRPKGNVRSLLRVVRKTGEVQAVFDAAMVLLETVDRWEPPRSLLTGAIDGYREGFRDALDQVAHCREAKGLRDALKKVQN